ncbi:MAG: CPBP family intramembrane glutamic endopeptidase [Bacteroidota bacterium]
MTSPNFLNNDYVEPVIAILYCLPGFIAYYRISASSGIYSFIRGKSGADKEQASWVVFQRITGVIFLGLIPAFICLVLFDKTLVDYGVMIGNPVISLYWILGSGILIIIVNMIFAGKPGNMNIYPQIRAKVWSLGLIVINSVSWMAYLLAYEFLIRGFLLFSCERAFSQWQAIAINTVIYSLVHIPKGAKETIGAIPFGYILCLITFETGTIWVAFFSHVILALSNDYFSLYYNPEMKIK